LDGLELPLLEPNFPPLSIWTFINPSCEFLRLLGTVGNSVSNVFLVSMV
jgi:hypothetical protein